MVLRWEGGAPSDAHEWIDALHEALGEEATFYWVRFYQKPEGWRFDLERHGEAPGPKGWSSYRRADDSSALRVFTALVERGKPLDPSWSQPTASAPAEVVPISRRAAQLAHTPVALPVPNPEPLPPSVPALPLTVVELKQAPVEILPLDLGTRAEPVSAALPAPNPEPLPSLVSAPSLNAASRTEIPLEPPTLDFATRTLPFSILVPASSPEPAPSSISAPPPTRRFPFWRLRVPRLHLRLPGWPSLRLPDWPSFRVPHLASLPLPRLPRLPLPDWPRFRVPGWRGVRVPDLRRLHLLNWASVRLPNWQGLRSPDWRLRLPDWPSVRLPDWRNLRLPDRWSLRLPDWPSLPVPAWRSLRLVLVYAPAILLFAWWLSRERLPGSHASSPSPAALRQVAQARLEEPQARPSPTQRPKGSLDVKQPRPRRVELVDVGAPGVKPPVLVSGARRPPYPPLALARGVSGTVLLNALVDETGRIVEIALVRTSAPGLGFEDAAMTHVYSRVYRPATKRGVPVRVRLPVMVDFTLPPR